MWGMIPPTKAALEEHVNRAAYQGGHMGPDTIKQGSSGGACQEGRLPGKPCVGYDTANKRYLHQEVGAGPRMNTGCTIHTGLDYLRLTRLAMS